MSTNSILCCLVRVSRTKSVDKNNICFILALLKYRHFYKHYQRLHLSQVRRPAGTLLWEALVLLVSWNNQYFMSGKQSIGSSSLYSLLDLLRPVSKHKIRKSCNKSAMFLCKCRYFYLCKCRHLWIEICCSETCVAHSLWTVALKLFCLKP